MDEIMEKLLSTRNALRMIILIAPPGMGKSEVAIRVGHLLQGKDWPVVYVAKQNNLLEICDEILYQLDHRHWTLNSSIVSHAKRKLSELDEETVIILDNTEDASSYRVGGSRPLSSKVILNNANSITTIHQMDIILSRSFYRDHFMEIIL